MLASSEFQSLGRAIEEEEEDGTVNIVSWREHVFRLWWEERKELRRPDFTEGPTEAGPMSLVLDGRVCGVDITGAAVTQVELYVVYPPPPSTLARGSSCHLLVYSALHCLCHIIFQVLAVWDRWLRLSEGKIPQRLKKSPNEQEPSLNNVKISGNGDLGGAEEMVPDVFYSNHSRKDATSTDLNLFVVGVFHNSTPIYLVPRFTLLASLHNRDTLSQHNLVLSIPFHHTSLYSASFTIHTARSWNSLSQEIRSSRSLKSFKYTLLRNVFNEQN
ncbi:hypothetical protein ANN_05359 [Periplaneta americana]|uniref:Uncharacterized protein n=1 Tax=Periplaneta americana TaxID=6978 RepID=A0ABQ8TAX6_PERAM|nr:hypothetical protein ANN_05359 [Periplaneta americana]